MAEGQQHQPESISLQKFLDAATVSPEIFQLRPDYRVLLLAIDGIPSGPSDDTSEAQLLEAESSVRASLSQRQQASSVTQLPHIAAWRDAYRAFGTKPQKFRNSLEALTRRAESGPLPRINRLTDLYNAVSVKHQIPFGGEDLDAYAGGSSPRLLRSTGREPFETTADGQAVTEHADEGEVVWCDGAGVTCRRWNWRQGTRTALTERTKRAVFILDLLDPVSDETAQAAADELVARLKRLNPESSCVRRMIRAS